MRILLLIISLLILTSSANATVYYRVKRGDTLGKIARKFKVSLRELKKINHLRSSTIYVGQRLKIPTKTSRKPHYTNLKKNYGIKYIYYRVRRGDSLSKIAKRYKTTVTAIKRANKLKSNRIYLGQKLKIPVKVVVRKHYSRSETQYKVSPKTTFVPEGLIKVPIYKYYRVRPGDSIIKIANKFRVSPREIIRINHLKRPYIIRPGWKLKILVGYRDVLKLNRPIQFRFPLDGRVDPTIREEGYPGIFIVSPPGTPVRAAETGIVRFAGKDNKLLKAFGNMVIIQHPKGYRTVYGNLKKIYVKPNQLVKRGEIIGTAGTSGIWGKSGLYFDISRVFNGKTYHIQPLEVLK